ncbi:putative MFS-type transporter [Smittium culicis]|uniref:Putative MFS-type transporter n=1 Tax=Smittium culicis TaxID=133412 RepID=A0A1R1XWU4_9FUNG|nr:putative MFS-type transporter [Smittium culicis]
MTAKSSSAENSPRVNSIELDPSITSDTNDNYDSTKTNYYKEENHLKSVTTNNSSTNPISLKNFSIEIDPQITASINGDIEAQQTPTSKPESDADKIIYFINRKNKKLFFCLIIAATVVANINQTLVNSSYSAIGNYFKALQYTSWLSLGYVIISCSSQPFFSPIISIVGYNAFFAYCWIFLSIATILSVIGSSMLMVIIGYSFSALGGIGMSIFINLLILHSFPLKQRSFYYGFSSFSHNVGNIFGPLFAPLLLTKYNFRSLFIALIIFIAIGMIICLFSMYKSNDSLVKVNKWKNFNFLSSFLLIASIISLACCLNGASGSSIFNLTTTIVLGCVFLVCLPLFFFTQSKSTKNKIIPIQIFTRRNEVIVYLSLVFIGSRYVSSSFFIPFYGSVILNLTKLKLGLISSFFYLGSSVSGLVFPLIYKRTKPLYAFVFYYLLIIGPSIAEVFFNQNTGFYLVSICEFIIGWGIVGVTLCAVMFFVSQPPNNLKPLYIGLFSFIITLGSMISSSILISVYSKLLTKKIAAVASSHPQYSSLILNSSSDSSIIFSGSYPDFVRDDVLKAFISAINIPLIITASSVSISCLIILFVKIK